MATNKLLDFQAKKPEKKPLVSIKTTLNVSFQQTIQKNKVLGLKGMTSW